MQQVVDMERLKWRLTDRPTGSSPDTVSLFQARHVVTSRLEVELSTNLASRHFIINLSFSI